MRLPCRWSVGVVDKPTLKVGSPFQGLGSEPCKSDSREARASPSSPKVDERHTAA